MKLESTSRFHKLLPHLFYNTGLTLFCHLCLTTLEMGYWSGRPGLIDWFWLEEEPRVSLPVVPYEDVMLFLWS